jgi:hypothetical protein
MSNRFANRKTLSLKGVVICKNSIWFINQLIICPTFLWRRDSFFCYKKYYKLKLKIVFLRTLLKHPIYETYKVCKLLFSLFFSLQGCEDMDDTAAPINLEVQDFIWKGTNIIYGNQMYLTYLMIVLHHKMNWTLSCNLSCSWGIIWCAKSR